MKKLFKILLPVCILLFGGYIRLSGNALAEFADDSALNNGGVAAFNLFSFSQDCRELIVKPVVSDIERENGLNHAAKVEEKEDELQSFKKHLDFNNDLNVPCVSQIPGYAHYYTQRFLFSNHNFSYLPSYSALFLRLGVLRI